MTRYEESDFGQEEGEDESGSEEESEGSEKGGPEGVERKRSPFFLFSLSFFFSFSFFCING